MLTKRETADHLYNMVQEYGDAYLDPNAKEGLPCHNVYLDDNDNVVARCIAAEVLHRHGVLDDALYRCNQNGIVGTVNTLGIEIELDALRMLHVAQCAQDGGATWKLAAITGRAAVDPLDR